MGSFFSKYLQTILQIIEDKPNFIISPKIYCVVIMVYFHQMAGYILSHFQIKPLFDIKLGFLAKIGEISPLTFLLYMKANDFLTLLFYIVMFLIMIFYFTYVGVLTYLKNYMKQQFSKFEVAFKSTNQLLNTFFTFYYWMFLVPFIEINSGVMACGPNSFLQRDRNTLNCEKPQYIMILSSLGLTFAVLSGIIIVFFFRNYEFNESNLLKRRFRSLIVFQMVLRCFQVFLYYQNFTNSIYVKHFLVHIIGILSFLDYYVYWPFSNGFISIFYLCYLVSFQNLMILTSIWIFSD